MNADWPCHMLSDFITIKHGYAFKGEYFVDQATPDCLVTPGNFLIGGGFKADKLKYYQGPVPDEYVLQPGDLIVTMTDLSKQADTLGYSALVPDLPDTRLLHNQRIGLVKLNSDKLHPDYLYFLLRSSEYRHHVVSSATGSTVKHTSPTKIASFEFQLPSLSVQKAVAETLLALEKKTQLNHQINQTLEQMAQAIFKSWFVDFEPVKAKIAARERWHTLQQGNEFASPAYYAGELADQPTNIDLETYMNHAAMEAVSGKDAEQLALMQVEKPEEYAELYATAELFPSAMQDSELGEIPEGWEILKLSNIVDLIGGGTPKKSEPSYWGGNICWFSVKDAPSEGNVFVIDTEEKITAAGLHGSSTRLLPIGTTIITARGTVGKLALTGVETAMNQSCYGIVGNDGTGPYLNYLRLNQAVETLKRNTHGAVFDTITRSTFDTVVQPRATLAIRNKFEEAVRPLFEAIRCNLHQIVMLSGIRDTLLPKLLSGELSVADIKTEVEA